MHKVAVCPGSFDPITNGHIDIAQRALGVFDQVIIAVGHNPDKKSLFTTEEKVAMIQASVVDEPRIQVESFEGLLVDYCQEVEAHAIVRGLRAIADFEMELQLALMNRKLSKDIETLFLMTSYRYLFVSSSIIKATASAGGSVAGLVPEPVFQELQRKFPRMKRK